MKKIALMTLVVMLAIFAFFYIQLEKLESAVTAKLAQYDTTFQAFHAGVFPTPYLSFENVQHNQIRIEKLTGTFDFFALLRGDIKLQQVDVRQARFSANAQNAMDIQMAFSDFSLAGIDEKKVSFHGENVISITLEKPLYGTNNRFQFSFIKGDIQQREDKKFEATFVYATLNQQLLGYIQAGLDFSQPTKHITAKMDSYCQPHCTAHFNLVSEPTQSAVIFSGENYPIERMLSLFHFPAILTGDSDFNVILHLADAQITDGRFSFSAHNGELLGLNLLDLVGQYLPINWNEAKFKYNAGINTKYEQVIANFLLKGHQLDVEKILLKTTALLGEGSGIVDLQSMQCNIDLNLRPTEGKYAHFSLPIRFFDSCYSPQYELHISKDLRKKIKDIIKRKLK